MSKIHWVKLKLTCRAIKCAKFKPPTFHFYFLIKEFMFLYKLRLNTNEKFNTNSPDHLIPQRTNDDNLCVLCRFSSLLSFRSRSAVLWKPLFLFLYRSSIFWCVRIAYMKNFCYYKDNATFIWILNVCWLCSLYENKNLSNKR